MNESLKNSMLSNRDGLVKVVTIRRMSEPEPIVRYIPQEAIAEVEELRRIFMGRFGDPDTPMAKVVIRRRHDQ